MYLQPRIEFNVRTVRTKSGKLIDKRFKRTFYQFQCDACGKDFEKDASHIATKKRLSNDYKHFCKDCFSYSLVSNLGKASYRRMLDERIGERHIDACGYMTVYVADTHPYSDGYCGRLREHILVMENHLERRLKKGEVVHHIDGNKLNNDLNNLHLMTVAEHNACHGKSEEVVFQLYKIGVVGYDRDRQRYFINDRNK